jgi:hypothetical protein
LRLPGPKAPRVAREVRGRIQTARTRARTAALECRSLMRAETRARVPRLYVKRAQLCRASAETRARVPRLYVKRAPLCRASAPARRAWTPKALARSGGLGDHQFKARSVREG